MDTAGTSETFVRIYQNTRRHIPEDGSYETNGRLRVELFAHLLELGNY